MLGITIVNLNRVATCGPDKQIYLWTLRGKILVAEDPSYNVDHKSHGIHYNGTYYCVLHWYVIAITVLDIQGRQVRKIAIKEAFGKKIRFGWDIHMDSTTHNIYAPCWDFNYGVLCVSVEGDPLLFFPLTGGPWGITEIHGVLCVADCREQCVHLMSKTGEYKGKLLDKDDISGKPEYICYDDRQLKLFFNVEDIVSSLCQWNLLIK